MAGVMEPSGPEVAPDPPRAVPSSLGTLRAARLHHNAAVLERMRPSEHQEKLVEETNNDVSLHSMEARVPSEDRHITDMNLSRRFVVVQWDSVKKRWKYRIVDDFSESGINDACQPVDRTTCQSRERFLRMAGYFLLKGKRFRLWKRDVKRAFRNCPVATDQLDLCGVIIMVDG